MKKTFLLFIFFNFSFVFCQESKLSKLGYIDFDNPFFEHMNYIESGSYSFFSKKIDVQQEDSLLFFTSSKAQSDEPFYISDHEVTNNEYRAFVNWVRDSIVRVKLYQRSAATDQAKWGAITEHPLANFGKNGERFFLNWQTPLDYDNPAIDSLLKDMYFQSDERFYKRKEIDTRFLVYRFYDRDTITNLIHVYPDTFAFSREVSFMNLAVAHNYFWHPAYGNYPVVGISYGQAKAYCLWRTQMYKAATPNKSRSGKNFFQVEFRLPTVEEWMLAASKGPYPLGASYQTDKNGCYYANYGESRLASGLLIKRSHDDGAQYQSAVHSYKPNLNGLFNLYGNVSEWLDSQPVLGDFYSDYMGISEQNIISSDSLQNIPIYITDPTTEQTFKVIKGSMDHRQLAQKRINYYSIHPEDSFVEVLRKYKELYSIGSVYTDSILALPHYKQKIRKWYSHDFETLYNFLSGSLFIHDGYMNQNYELLEEAYNAYQQNNSALLRLQNLSGFSIQMVSGGSWMDDAHYLEKGIVKVFPSYHASCTIGFRIAANATGTQIPKKDLKRLKKNKPKKLASGWDITGMNDLK